MTDRIALALVGKTITAVELSPDRFRLTPRTADGPVILRTEGDCCSCTWIEALDDPEALLGTVTAVEDLPMRDLGSVGTPYRPDVDIVSYYGLKVTTEKGRCVIDYRNDSNGYYGGSLELE